MEIDLLLCRNTQYSQRVYRFTYGGCLKSRCSSHFTTIDRISQAITTGPLNLVVFYNSNAYPRYMIICHSILKSPQTAIFYFHPTSQAHLHLPYFLLNVV